MTLRRAKPEMADELSQIAIRSKAYWGYSPRMLKAWERDLVISPQFVQTHEVYRCEIEAETAGFYALVLRKPVAILDHLWVRPSWIGRGCGRLLFEHAAGRAASAGAEAMEWVADPNARGFYERMGSRTLRHIRTELERVLPVMRVELPLANLHKED